MAAGRFGIQKANSTQRSSQAVPHPSTNRALCRLTSEVRRDPMFSTTVWPSAKAMNAALQPEASNMSRHAKSGWLCAKDRSKLLRSLAGESKHKERGNVAIRISITGETDKGTARLA